MTETGSANMIEWSCVPEVEGLLRKAGLDDFTSLAGKDIGEILRLDDNGREVRRISLVDAGEVQNF